MSSDDEAALGTCRVCGVRYDRRRYDVKGFVVGHRSANATCPAHRWSRRSADGSVSEVPLIDKTTPYERDVACQLFVATFAGGASLEAIALALGVSRERVRQIESEALRKLAGPAREQIDIEPAELAERRRHDVTDADADEEADDDAGELGGADDDDDE